MRRYRVLYVRVRWKVSKKETATRTGQAEDECGVKGNSSCHDLTSDGEDGMTRICRQEGLPCSRPDWVGSLLLLLSSKLLLGHPDNPVDAQGGDDVEDDEGEQDTMDEVC
jgi:hypothetical protein